jgi:hypothetical protein
VADERVVLLLSDCLHTSGDAPEVALAGLDTLHVLYPPQAEGAAEAARALAARGGGMAVPVGTLTDVAPALTRLLG